MALPGTRAGKLPPSLNLRAPVAARFANTPFSLAEFLLIDIGNTAVKFRLANARALLGGTRRVPTTTLGESPDTGGGEMALVLRSWTYRRVVLCSVVPEVTENILKLLPVGIPTRIVHHKLAGLGVDLSLYPQRRTLGADRLANMAGALARQGIGRGLIVVDFGTAATFNVLDHEGRFIGGMIAPGFASMRGYLSARGAQLPVLKAGRLPARAVAIGTSTREAMLAGTVIGYRGLAGETLRALKAEAPGARVVATGGDAGFVSRLLPGDIDAVEPDLTMHGLRVIGGGDHWTGFD